MEGVLVLAFGGHALSPDQRRQEERADAFSEALSRLVSREAGAVLVHGNGPQVGLILLRIEATKDRIPPETLDILVAETQGSIGYILSRAIRSRSPDREVAAVLTQVLVDAEGPDLGRPVKPVGPYYSEEEALSLSQRSGWHMSRESEKGWRRLVPSPRPLEIVEMHTIAEAAAHGQIVIAGGGGGIPVIRRGGLLKGVEAVIDKDLTAGLLAISLRAERLIILTDVPHVSTGFKTPSQRPIRRMDAGQAEELLRAGEFPRGTMGPKVEAAIRYVKETGRGALITDLDHLERALEREEGTWILPKPGIAGNERL